MTITPLMIPIVGMIFGTVMIVAIVAIVIGLRRAPKNCSSTRTCAFGKWNTSAR